MLLGENMSFTHILRTYAELARLPPYGFFCSISQRLKIADHLKDYAADLTLAEAELFTYAPVNIRDDNVLSAFKGFMRDFVDHGRVDVEQTMDDVGLLDNFDRVQSARDQMPDGKVTGPSQPGVVLTPIPSDIVQALPTLESSHKALVLYIWLSFRLELAFPERLKAVELKEKVEELLDFCLERLPGLKRTPGHMLGRRHRKQQIRTIVEEQPKQAKTLSWLTREEAVGVRTTQRFGNVEIMEG